MEETSWNVLPGQLQQKIVISTANGQNRNTTVVRLGSPVASKATFGSDVTKLTLTYPVIPNMESYYLQLMARNMISQER